MSPSSLVSADASADGLLGEQCRGPVGGQLPVPGQCPDEDEADRVDGDRDAHDHREDHQRVLVGPAAAAEQLGVEREAHDDAGDHTEERGHRDHGDVAVRHMGQLVREDALQLVGLQAAQQARGHAQHRVIGVAAGGEGVRQVGAGNGHLRFRHVGGRAQPVDDAVQLGLLLTGHDAAVHGVQGDPVGEPVLRPEESRGDHDDQERRLEQDQERGDERHVQQAQQEHGDQHARGQLPVGLEPAPSGLEGGCHSRHRLRSAVRAAVRAAHAERDRRCAHLPRCHVPGLFRPVAHGRCQFPVSPGSRRPAGSRRRPSRVAPCRRASRTNGSP